MLLNPIRNRQVVRPAGSKNAGHGARSMGHGAWSRTSGARGAEMQYGDMIMYTEQDTGLQYTWYETKCKEHGTRYMEHGAQNRTSNHIKEIENNFILCIVLFHLNLFKLFFKKSFLLWIDSTYSVGKKIFKNKFRGWSARPDYFEAGHGACARSL